jgi:hypothetical protein
MERAFKETLRHGKERKCDSYTKTHGGGGGGIRTHTLESGLVDDLFKYNFADQITGRKGKRKYSIGQI